MKLIFMVIFTFYPMVLFALEPEEILVIANRNSGKSPGLARFYMEKRKIPDKNLLLLWMDEKEVCTRKDYEKKVIPPVRRYLSKPENLKIRAVVTIYGIPLKISGPELSREESLYLKELEKEERLLLARKQKNKDPKQKNEIDVSLGTIQYKKKNFKLKKDRTASFDSELSLVRFDYNIDFWTPNPYFIKFKKYNLGRKKKDILMVSRLDGSSPEIVKRMIIDSIFAEKNGLKGKGCFDARWKYPQKKEVKGYALYDRSIHHCFIIAEDFFKGRSVLNDSRELFKKGECKETAFYCGWYSHGRYIDSFTWERGSIGYHIASSECVTLKKESRVWCKNILDKGGAVTIGPVEEPYLESFPYPEYFFELLFKGNLSLVESYYLSLPYLSWKMVLIGDPLYRPFFIK